MRFSIIIPVYNMERYIVRCFDSVLKQTYVDFEIVAIDDGSTDNSPQILDEYEINNQNLHVIHQTNTGIGGAVKKGLEYAKGEYICFVDSDDYIDLNMLEALDEIVLNHNYPSIIQYGLIFEDEYEKTMRTDHPKERVLNKTEAILKDHFEGFTTPSLACRSFKKELFDGIEYINQNIGVDEVIFLQLLLNAESVVNSEKCYYHVFLRDSSVSRNKLSDTRIREYEKVYEMLLRITYDKNKFAYNHVVIKNMKLLQELYCGIDVGVEFERVFFDRFRRLFQYIKDTDEYRTERLLYKIGACIYMMNPKLYRVLRRMK